MVGEICFDSPAKFAQLTANEDNALTDTFAGWANMRATIRVCRPGGICLYTLQFDQFFAMRFELRERTGFVRRHEAAVADNIGGKYRS
jgi:hypothetical protein